MKPTDRTAAPEGTAAQKIAARDSHSVQLTTDKIIQDPLTGIDRALAGASPWDTATITAAITDRAANPGAFTIEDALELAGIEVDPASPNLIGAVAQRLAKAGVIVGVSYTRARRASRSGGVVRVWRGVTHD